MEQSPFWEVKEFHAFYGTRKYITAFTSARHQSLSREIFDRHASVFFFLGGGGLIPLQRTTSSLHGDG